MYIIHYVTLSDCYYIKITNYTFEFLDEILLPLDTQLNTCK